MSLKAQIYLEEIAEGITSPFFDGDGYLNFVSSTTGEISTINKNQETVCLCNSGGQPAAAKIFNGKLYVTDLVNGVCLFTSSGDEQLVARIYEDKPFKGPNSITFDSLGNMYFTDGGPFGETGVHKPQGSVYCITSQSSGQQQLLKPIISECLAYPSGIAVSPDDKILYVTEQMANRVVRLVQRPAGVFHTSIFHQFSGGMGPSAIICDRRGNLYVARYDYASVANEGIVVVLDKNGNLKTEISIPAPEISGLVLSDDGKSLFVTESSTKNIYKVDVSEV